MPVIDVEKLIRDDKKVESLDLKFGDKVFHVYDIPLDMFIKLTDEGLEKTSAQVIVKRLAFMLHTTEEEIMKYIGINGAMKAMQLSLDWFQRKTEQEAEEIPLGGKEQSQK